MFIDNIIPSPALSAFIRVYKIIDFYFPKQQLLFPKLYIPRPEICLQFYAKDREKIQYADGEEASPGNTSRISGRHTIIQSRFVPKKISFGSGCIPAITMRREVVKPQNNTPDAGKITMMRYIHTWIKTKGG